MTIKPLVLGIALSAVATLAAAGNDGVESRAGQGPALDSPQSPAAPAVKELHFRPGHWTAERYRGARPMPLPSGEEADQRKLIEEMSASQYDAESTQEPSNDAQPGRPPLLEPDERESLEKRLYVPDESRSEQPKPGADPIASEGPNRQRAGAKAIPSDVGVRRAYFSSQPLVPLAADREYPYSAVGRLFFTIPGQGDFACSGSVISARLVLTAGHCVHSGSGNEQGWFTNIEFAPAYRDGVAPYSTWKAAAAFVTDPWYRGMDKVPNVADYALIELEDQLVGGVSRRVGEVVGLLGYQTNSLMPNHAHLIGYPKAFEAGERMHQVTAQSYRRETRYNTVLYGSDMNEGSSGGPWIMNFGPAAAGQSGANDPGRNRVIGVTSYGFDTLEVQGSSTLNETFTSLLGKACAHREGNCQ
ncbi:MAG: trypsin-like serine protease [Candidatus Competibacter sp.]|nr:trypsin-like serine protease [Candidatus Competibacter sp.]